MQPQLFAYVISALCVLAFFELMLTFRKSSLLKLFFVLVIASLFTMNYFAFAGVTSRLQLLLARAMRMVYVCSMMLAVVYLVKPRIPRWIIWLIGCSLIFSIGVRVYYYQQINIEQLAQQPNQLFSVGAEFYTPKLLVRAIIYVLTAVSIIITFYYYRLFLTRINAETPHYLQFSWWIISLVAPFFLLTIFGVLGSLGIFLPALSSFLFSFFSCMIVFSIMLRPRALNTKSLADILSVDTIGLKTRVLAKQ